MMGEFVNLRPLMTDDAGITFEWRRSDRAINLNRSPSSVEEQRNWIMSRPSSEYNFIIETKAGHPVGMLSLVDVDMVHLRAEPARFLIGDEHATRGIPAAAEAMKLLYELAFDRLGLRRVYGGVVSDNTKVLKWQLFTGMVKEGVSRDHMFINGHYQDAIMLGMLEHEYRKTALPRLNALIAVGHMHVSNLAQQE